MKIININSSRLNNGDFYQFIENIIAIAVSEPVVATILTELQNDIAPMQDSFKKEKLNAETAKIVAADFKRDRALTHLILKLKAEAINDRQPDHIEPANRLQLIVKNYGGGEIVSFDFNKETAHLTNLVADMLSKPADVALLNLADAIDFIKTTNLDFQTLYKNRGDAMGDLKNVVPFYKLRKLIEEHYKSFMQATESLPKINPATKPQIESLMTRLNVEIEKFKLLIPTKVATPPIPVA